MGGAESCVECALWTASAAKGNPSVVNHPVVAMDFLHGIETARDPETVSTQTSFRPRSLRNFFEIGKLKMVSFEEGNFEVLRGKFHD